MRCFQSNSMAKTALLGCAAFAGFVSAHQSLRPRFRRAISSFLMVPGIAVSLVAGALVVSLASAKAVAAPVVDINDSARQERGVGVQAGDGSADMFYQMQILQEEIRQLRGMLEEQSHQLGQLKQRQLENYSDLDGRLSALTASMSALPSGSDVQTSPVDSTGEDRFRTNVPTTNQPPSEGAADSGERAQYNAAYALLKARRLDKSLAAFRDFSLAFPDGSYLPNAYYWMGEIHLVKGNLREAAAEFERVVEHYPAHRKTPDARYKLGTVYYQMGDGKKARQHLETAAAGSGSSARLAQRYLEVNF